ncbi:MAG TPA: hypothetical protein DCM87_11985 [Planctomycetes bacterium]|nr:hypothetical protein [Planctomycetota bacterium]
MDETIKTVVALLVVFTMVVAPLLKKVLDRGKAQAPPPRRPEGGGEGEPARDLRGFLKQLEDLAQGREPTVREAPKPQRKPVPVAAPARRPAATRRPVPAPAPTPGLRRPERVAQSSMSADTRAQATAVETQARAAAGAGMRAQGAAGRAPGGDAARRPRGGRLPIVSAGGTEDFGALIVWSEILGKPRAARPWRAPKVVSR